MLVGVLQLLVGTSLSVEYAGQCINDGCYNVAIGDQAGCCMMSGNSNTVVGSFAAI